MPDGSWAPPEMSHATVALRDAEEPVAPGGLIGERYRVISLLGRGGMGEVYEAEDVQLGGRVALKVVRGSSLDSHAFEMLKREIQLARRVTHPNVCRLHDFDVHRFADGRETPFLTMELVHGETLAAAIRRKGPFSPAQTRHLAEQMAGALDAAHDAGVVHRDFKSSNVMLEGDRAIVTDFGLAMEMADATHRGDHSLVGSPAYMAPEQFQGGRVSAASDVYASGVVLFEMITGRLPFEGPTPIATAHARLKTPPPSPRSHVRALDRRWEVAILRCMRLDPSQRFARCGDVVRLLPRPAARSSSPLGTLAILFGVGGLGFFALILATIFLWVLLKP